MHPIPDSAPRGLLLSPALMALSISPAEKVLLARICQTAAHQGGSCQASNAELAIETAIPFSTLTKLIGRLIDAGWISTQVRKRLANRRVITPHQRLLADYQTPTPRGLLAEPVEGESFPRQELPARRGGSLVSPGWLLLPALGLAWALITPRSTN